LEEADAGFTVEETTERVKLLLRSQVMRAGGFIGVSPQNLKVCVEKPAGKVGRRELAAMLLPQYQVIPWIGASLCSGGLKCSLCKDICPLGAITIEEDTVEIAKDICSGCGACVAVCPHRAVSYPTFSLEELDRELQGLLACPDIELDHHIIAFTESSFGCGDEGDGQSRFPLCVLPVRLPSLSMASPLLMLRALDLGTKGLVLIHDTGARRSDVDVSSWLGHVKFVQELLDLWGIGGNRIKVFDVDRENIDTVQLELGRFAEEIEVLPPTPFADGERSPVDIDRRQLGELIQEMEGRLPQPSKGTVTGGAVPFGMVELDGAKCTGCCLCAINCPTDAISILTDKEGDGYSIPFDYDLCVGCGVCVNICPEGCVELERVLELSELGAGSAVLFEDSFIKCRRCGGYVAPRSMIERLKSRLQDTNNGEESWTELCPDCRLSVQLQR
jgi:ferredoxin